MPEDKEKPEPKPKKSIWQITPHNSDVVKRLIAEGIIPGECRKWTLTCEPDATVVMQMEVFVTGEQMDKIAAALADNPEEAKALAREIIFVDPAKRPNRPLGTPKTAKVNLP